MNKLALVVSLAAVAAVAALAAGCATVAPEHRLADTQGRSPEQLAVIAVQSDEVKIVEVDGKPFPGAGTSNFYIVPGTHRILVGLNWCPGGQCQYFGSFADKPRPVCIEVKAGNQYRFSTGSPGPDWLPRVTLPPAGADTKPVVVDSRCA